MPSVHVALNRGFASRALRNLSVLCGNGFFIAKITKNGRKGREDKRRTRVFNSAVSLELGRARFQSVSRLQGSWKSGPHENAFSREAATDCSPRRQPWVKSRNEQAPKERKSGCGTGSLAPEGSCCGKAPRALKRADPFSGLAARVKLVSPPKPLIKSHPGLRMKLAHFYEHVMLYR